jgi:hypothetical protein
MIALTSDGEKLSLTILPPNKYANNYQTARTIRIQFHPSFQGALLSSVFLPSPPGEDFPAFVWNYIFTSGMTCQSSTSRILFSNLTNPFKSFMIIIK